MKLSHAIRTIERLVASEGRGARVPLDAAPVASQERALSPEETIALNVLVQFTKRVSAAKSAIQVLHRAVGGEEDLNQMSMLDSEEKSNG